MDDRPPIHERIKELRKSLKISQDELAKRMGYKSRSTISKIESGENDFPRNKIADFAKALQVSERILLGWTSHDAFGNEIYEVDPHVAKWPPKEFYTEPFQLTHGEYVFIRKYHCLDRDGKELLKKLLDTRLTQLGYVPDQICVE